MPHGYMDEQLIVPPLDGRTAYDSLDVLDCLLHLRKIPRRHHCEEFVLLPTPHKRPRAKHVLNGPSGGAENECRRLPPVGCLDMLQTIDVNVHDAEGNAVFA